MCRARAPPSPAAAAAPALITNRAALPPFPKTTKPQPQKVTGEELEKLLADGDVRKVPVIVDLFATWCGPCLLLAEELEKVAAELGPEGVRIFKVDVDAEQELASQLQVRGGRRRRRARAAGCPPAGRAPSLGTPPPPRPPADR